MPVVYDTIGIVPPVTFTNTWNPSDQATTTLSNGNLTGSCTTINGSIVRAVATQLTGKYYFEVTWSGAFRGTATMVGIAQTAPTLASISATATGSILYSA